MYRRHAHSIAANNQHDSSIVNDSWIDSILTTPLAMLEETRWKYLNAMIALVKTSYHPILRMECFRRLSKIPRNRRKVEGCERRSRYVDMRVTTRIFFSSVCVTMRSRTWLICKLDEWRGQVCVWWNDDNRVSAFFLLTFFTFSMLHSRHLEDS